MTNDENDLPWGTYAPNGFNNRLIGWSRAMPRNRLGRLGAGLLRRLVMAGLDRPLDLITFDVPVRFHLHDNLTEKRVAFMPQFFDVDERAALSRIIHSKFVFIDIGANAGFYSLFVAGMAGKQARVIAVEPQGEMARRLRFNCTAAGLGQIIHEGTALSDGPGVAVLNIVHENRGASGFAPRGRNLGNETAPVPTMALLALMDRHKIQRADAIKIDIEGAEDQVLPTFFETCPPARLPKMFIIERNDNWAVDCLNLAQNAGYCEVGKGRKNAILKLTP